MAGRTTPSAGKRTYAITFTIDPESLNVGYPSLSIETAHREISEILAAESFLWMNDGIWYGIDGVNAVTCVLAAQQLARALPWFGAVVRDIRMLRIEESSDLGAALAPSMAAHGID